MAVEDIPPRRSGLGKRLGEILANAPAVGPRTESVIFGGEVTATPEEVKESLTYVTGEAEEAGTPSIPTPDSVFPEPDYTLDHIRQSTGSLRAVKRPDLYDDFYGRARNRESTRVYGMQWIPTFANEDIVMGDLLVAFARATGINGGSIYVYVNVSQEQWLYIRHECESFGKEISKLSHYHVFSTDDRLKYEAIHAKTDGGKPWTLWIWDDSAKWSSGRQPNESANWDPSLARGGGGGGRRVGGAEATKRAREASKAGRREAREERRRSQGR